jgi:hypothetical protein
MTSPAGIKIGTKTLDQTWMSQGRVVGGYLECSPGNYSVRWTINFGVAAGSVSAGATGVISIPTGLPNTNFIVHAIGYRSGVGVLFGGFSASPGYTPVTDASGYAQFTVTNYAGTTQANLDTGAAWHLQVFIMVGASTF